MQANPYAPPLASVRDIAHATTANMPAERGARLGAAILDTLIFFGMVYVPLFAGTFVGAAAASGSDESAAGGMMAIGLLLGLVGFVAYVWLNLKQMQATGQSLGKKYVGIKVVRSDGSAVTLGRLVWLRNVVNWLISIIPLYGLVDVLFIFGESRQCLHDKLADTMVVKA
jgi:uncharacterized RDD family membrane protein YckC